MMERLTVKWTDKVYDTLDPVDILDNEYSKTNYNKLLTKLGEYEDFEEIFLAKMTDIACEFLKDKEEFGKWLDRNKWIAKKCDEYARAEEQGLLLRLPCKVGDTVYSISNDGKIYPVKSTREVRLVNGMLHIICESCKYADLVSCDDIGKTVFLTQAEAEQKLKEMESD